MSPPAAKTVDKAKSVTCASTWMDLYLGVADADVVLHVYHLGTSRLVKGANAVLRKMGTGFFHVGIEVHGVEWSFGWNQGGSGIYSCVPGGSCQHGYCGPVALGKTRLASVRVATVISDMSKDWLGPEYSVLGRNCCSFSDEFCKRLGVGPLPRWVRSLAAGGGRLGSLAGGGKGAKHGHRLLRATSFLRPSIAKVLQAVSSKEKAAKALLPETSSSSSSSSGCGSYRNSTGLKGNLSRSLSGSTMSTIGSFGLLSLHSAHGNGWRQIGGPRCWAPLKE
mmetsp:Transcript_5304/g.9984  ORF Transcript_5304/g.9984 Transcript_5304/m.9984 type:complete len:279 (+) Transcript_5304:46-882(+)